MRIFEPTPCINYNFISLMYGAFSLIGTALYLLETLLFAPHQREQLNKHDTATGAASNQNENDVAIQTPTVSLDIGDEKSVLKELAESTEGLYLIFIPFIPCLLWSLVVRKTYCKLQKEKKAQEQDQGADSSKKKEE